MSKQKNQMNETISVSELTNQIKLLIETGFDKVSVKGEISNFVQHSSGHRYFTLKDANAQISCVMWKSRKLDFKPENGAKITATGFIDVYPPQGKYQLDCATLEPFGLGDLYVAFEKLKNDLRAKGYFDSDRKREIPRSPKRIGVSTSPTGAAVRDIFTTIERRFPLAEIYFRPTIVQGDSAIPDIARAIQELNEKNCDVIIIGRGGGSIEDLWAYNTEPVAKSIFNSKTPIISAVGHETDFTIADFVADQRAATPTAAAELTTSVTKEYLLDYIDALTMDFKNSINVYLSEKKDIVGSILSDYTERRLLDRIRTNAQRIDELETRARASMKNSLLNKRRETENIERICRSLSPSAPFDKGFALLKKGEKILTASDEILEFDYFDVIRKDTIVSAQAEKIRRKL